MEYFECTGATVEEAIENGLKENNLTKEQVEVEIIQEATKGFFGIGKTLAKVKLTKKMTDSQRAVEFLDGLFDLINVKATCEVTRDDEDKICIQLNASNSSFLIGYRGEILDSLQTFAGAVANIGREDYKRVVVDCEQYREKREQTLIDLANRLADKAVKYGRKVNLEPMNPFERRIIHTALGEREDVNTQSMGKEPNRFICIIPNEITDERPLSADRNKQRFDKGNNKNFRKMGKGSNKYGSRDNKRGNKGETTIYGKPKDKHNVTSFGTFIGNSHKNED